MFLTKKKCDGLNFQHNSSKKNITNFQHFFRKPDSAKADCAYYAEYQ